MSGKQPVRVAQIMGMMNGGGVEAVVMNYYRHIDRSRVQFDFLVCTNSELVPREEIESLGGRVFMVPSYQHVVVYQRELQRLFRQESWHIVHSHVNALSVFPLRAAKKVGVPVRIAHSHSTSGKGEHVKNVVKAILKTQANRYPTHRLACSRYAGEWLFGKGADFGVMYNAIDLNLFAFNAGARAQVRADLGLVDDQFVIGHVGRFMAQKNHLFLIDVFSQVVQRRQDAVLILVGTGESEAFIKSIVAERGLTNHVMFLGQRFDVDRLYSAFDAFVLPSLYEGLCLVGVEAQAAGLPCLLSDTITREVDVTGTVDFLPIDDASIWADRLTSTKASGLRDVDFSRFDHYEIASQSKRLADFYLSLVSNTHE